jgi:hypothetical protein
VLYITELIGILLIWGGYSLIESGGEPSVHPAQQPAA